MRSLASVLKYDKLIPQSRDSQKLRKGYYSTERDLVYKIKEFVVGDKAVNDFRTIECSIMDLADDIAYSTYDLEDAFKNGFLSPVSMMSLDDGKKKKIADEVAKKMRDEYKDSTVNVTEEDVNEVFLAVFSDIYSPSADFGSERTSEELNVIASTQVYSRSAELCDDGYLRADFTSRLVHSLIQGIEFFPNYKHPALSVVKFKIETFKIVEILKRTAYSTLIDSNRLKMAEHRGTEIINHIFSALITPEQGMKLLPKDWRVVYEFSDSRHRAVCDFIAGMTDRYCVEFYSKLIGINAPSIQTPY